MRGSHLRCIAEIERMDRKLSFWIHFVAALVLLILTSKVRAQVCVNGFQCLSCSQAQICVGGTPSGSAITCPTSTYCLNTNAQVCSYGTCPTGCVAPGIFADPTNPNQYILCISTGSGTYIQTIVPCPTGSTFNPLALQCVAITTTTPSTTTASTTTTTATTTTAVATTTPIYPCTSIGRYNDPRNCSIYYMCSLNPSGGFYVYKYTCPTTTLFDPRKEKCVLASASSCVPTSG